MVHVLPGNCVQQERICSEKKESDFESPPPPPNLVVGCKL